MWLFATGGPVRASGKMFIQFIKISISMFKSNYHLNVHIIVHINVYINVHINERPYLFMSMPCLGTLCTLHECVWTCFIIFAGAAHRAGPVSMLILCVYLRSFLGL